MISNKQRLPSLILPGALLKHLFFALSRLTCSLKGPPKQDSMVQSLWLDDSDCTPSTSSSPGKKERKIEKTLYLGF